MSKIDRIEEKIFDLNLEAMMARSGEVENIIKEKNKLSLLLSRLLKVNKIKKIIICLYHIFQDQKHLDLEIKN